MGIRRFGPIIILALVLFHTILLCLNIGPHLYDFTQHNGAGYKHLAHQDPKTTSSLPPEILITDAGYFQIDKEKALRVPRSLRTKALIEGIQAHPWYNHTAWEELRNGRLQPDGRRRYIFLDIDTCADANWPFYGTGSRELNSDTAGGRPPISSVIALCRNLRKVLNSTFFNTSLYNFPGVKLILFECQFICGFPAQYKDCDADYVSIATISRSLDDYKPSVTNHQGMVPPPVHPVPLSPQEVDDIQSCRAESNRQILFSFIGRTSTHPFRKAISYLHNGQDIITDLHNVKEKGNHPMQQKLMETNNLTTQLDFYFYMMKSSKFGAVPRGDDLFSYRFSEVISGGAIPVIYSDGWMLPFRKELVDWNKIAVVIKQTEASRTMEILSSISDEERCKMRKRLVEVYNKYMQTPLGEISGYVEGLEQMAAARDAK